jgi:hypothetical protein
MKQGCLGLVLGLFWACFGLFWACFRTPAYNKPVSAETGLVPFGALSNTESSMKHA